METTKVISIIDALDKKIAQNSLLKEDAKITRGLKEARAGFEGKVVPDRLKEVFVSLEKKGRELLKKSATPAIPRS